MSDSIAALRIFVRVARTGSFSRAARDMRLPQSSVSRIITGLERDVGTTLLRRSTRVVVLTDAGADYLARIEPILDALDQANQAARGSEELRGTLRVGAPASIALRMIVPLLPEFMERHPSLRVDLRLEDRFQDLLREGMDVTLRMGKLADSTATSRLVGDNQRVLVASAEYLNRTGAPRTPLELATHSLILGPTGVDAGSWTFKRKGKTIVVRAEGRLAVNLNEGATASAVAGLGILSTGLWGCRKEVQNGSLVRVLEEWTMEQVEMRAVFPAGRAAKFAARAFIDHVANNIER